MTTLNPSSLLASSTIRFRRQTLSLSSYRLFYILVHRMDCTRVRNIVMFIVFNYQRPVGSRFCSKYQNHILCRSLIAINLFKSNQTGNAKRGSGLVIIKALMQSSTYRISTPATFIRIHPKRISFFDVFNSIFLLILGS